MDELGRLPFRVFSTDKYALQKQTLGSWRPVHEEVRQYASAASWSAYNAKVQRQVARGPGPDIALKAGSICFKNGAVGRVLLQ